MESLNPPFGLNFGLNKKSVIAVLKKRNGYIVDEEKSDDTILFEDLYIADREINSTYCYFVNDQLSKVKLVFNTYLDVKILIREYETIKTEINSKYYHAHEDHFNFIPPASKDDDIEKSYAHNINLGLIEIFARWKFSSTGNFEDNIVLLIHKNESIELIYENGILGNQYKKLKKLEW